MGENHRITQQGLGACGLPDFDCSASLYAPMRFADAAGWEHANQAPPDLSLGDPSSEDRVWRLRERSLSAPGDVDVLAHGVEGAEVLGLHVQDDLTHSLGQYDPRVALAARLIDGHESHSRVPSGCMHTEYYGRGSYPIQRFKFRW